MRHRRLAVSALVSLVVMAGLVALPRSASASGAPPHCSAPASTTYGVGANGNAGYCSDPESDPTVYTVTKAPSKGTLEVVAQGTIYAGITYTPNSIGDDAFAYTVSDGTGTSPEVFVHAHNVPANQHVPWCDAYPADEYEVGDLITDTLVCDDADGDKLHMEIVNAPHLGKATISAQDTTSPRLSYQASQMGSDTVSVRASDDYSSSEIATLHTTNRPETDDTPTCATGTSSAKAEVGDTRSVASCFDDEGERMSFTLVSAPTKGTATVHNADAYPWIEYVGREVGQDELKYRVTDGNSTSAVYTAELDNTPAINDPPECWQNSWAKFEVGRAVSAVMCSDDEGDPLTYRVVKPPSIGAATVVQDGVEYKAARLGEDEFTVIANDGHSDSAVTNVKTKNVPFGNHTPYCWMFGDLSMPVGQENWAGMCKDDEHDAVRFKLLTPPRLGSVKFQGEGTEQFGGSVYYPMYWAKRAGTDHFSFTMSDGHTTSAPQAVTVHNTVAQVTAATGTPTDSGAALLPMLIRTGSPSKPLVQRHGTFGIGRAVRCPGKGPACHVASRARRGHRTLATSRVAIAAHHSKTIVLRLSRRARRQLRHRRRVRVALALRMTRGKRTARRAMKLTLRLRR